MNCRIAAALVDDFIDNSLATDPREEISRHIESCPACRSEFESRLYLKEQLAQLPRPARSDSYWNNQAELILARTVERGVPTQHPDRRSHTGDDLRRSFYRSLLAAAASIAILIGSLTLGSAAGYRPVAVFEGSTRATVTPALASQLGRDRLDLMISRDLAIVGRASLVLGPPGSVSRISSLNDFVAPK